MPSIGENINKYRTEKGMRIARLAEASGLTEGAIRNYEKGIRKPSDAQLEVIAQALDVSVEALKDHQINSARDLIGMLIRLEDDFGLTPGEDGETLIVDRKATSAAKTKQALKAWSNMKKELKKGKITAKEYDDWKSKF